MYRMKCYVLKVMDCKSCYSVQWLTYLAVSAAENTKSWTLYSYTLDDTILAACSNLNCKSSTLTEPNSWSLSTLRSLTCSCRALLTLSWSLSPSAGTCSGAFPLTSGHSGPFVVVVVVPDTIVVHRAGCHTLLQQDPWAIISQQ